jgi:hypothetical protein
MPDGFTVHDVEIARSGGAYGSVQGLDVTVCDGVIVQFASLNEDGTGFGVWGVEIDGHLYREPRDLSPEPMQKGPWLTLLEQAVKAKGGPRTDSVALDDHGAPVEGRNYHPTEGGTDGR